MISKNLKHLAEQIQKNSQKLNRWYHEQALQTPPPFYCSIDLRDSGHKIVPVDCNLYPAGFNNVCPEDRRTAPPLFRKQMEILLERKQLKKPVEKVLILPESHTQNTYYIENLYYLKQIISDAGYDVQVGWYSKESEPSSTASTAQKLRSFTGKEFEAFPIQIQNGMMQIPGFVPDVILLNNDFSGGYPHLLDQVTQPILPSHTLGWHSRKKSDHFRYYNQLASEFANLIGVDPWIIQIDTEEVEPVNFGDDEGTEKVAQAVDRILTRTQQAYQNHQIDRKPFVFVKNNSGTYGMGIMVAHSSDELRTMNRRTKNKMSMGKNHLPIRSVVVQEGVPTATHVNSLSAEPVIYLFGCHLIGGFLRTNTEKGDEENLNSQGMVFKKLCMSDLRESEGEAGEEGVQKLPLLELVYGSIARLSALATGMEFAHRKQSLKDSSPSHPLPSAR